MEHKILHIKGMSCVGCENIIKRKLLNTAGIVHVEVSYNTQTVNLTYDTDTVSLSDIKKLIEALDYQVLSDNKNSAPDSWKLLEAVFFIFALYLLMKRLGLTNLLNIFPEAEEGMEYSMLFIIGLLTSLHCVAMCGGINLSQCMNRSLQTSSQEPKHKLALLKPSIFYNLGRVISYTFLGGVIGAIGSVVSFSGSAKGIVQILAGIFMVIMGFNMLNVFPSLRFLIPRLPKQLTSRIHATRNGLQAPFTIGLLNGLMPCGPLQAMQLYALSTGSPLKGAFSMFLFSLGTVPLMFALGALSSVVSKKFTNKILTVGAVLVVFLGLSMFGNGISLSGITLPTLPSSQGNVAQSQVADGIQVVKTSLSSGSYEPISVQAGVPVTWTIYAEAGTVNGCNNEILIPEYGIVQKLEIGENIIEFTPTETGTFTYSCWMGMIRSTITVNE